MPSKKDKKTGKRLTGHELQIQILRFLLAHPKKRYTAGQVVDHLSIDNTKESVEHALRQLAKVGSAMVSMENKYTVALERLTIEDAPEAEEPKTPLAEKFGPAETPGFSKHQKSSKKQSSGDAEIASPEKFGPDETPGVFEGKKSLKQKSAGGGKTDSPEKFERENPPGKSRAKIPPKYEPPAEPAPLPLKTQHSKLKNRLVEGRMDMTRTGSGYVVSGLENSDTYVGVKNMHGALHGDTVRVSVFPKRPPRRRGEPERKPEGEVIAIVSRATEHFIGTLRISRKYALFLPDNPLVVTDFYVPLDACGGARDGEKVVVRITDWQEGTNRVPIGKVTQVLGEVGGNEFEMKKILINAGFELQHSEAAEAEAAGIPDRISPQEIALRRDFRDVLTFTIDPEDAKDFDDALSFKELDGGKIEVGIHIADVTHFLKPDSPLDKEAFKRSTSVYLVDRCNPMLPEKLSNNLCSLVPHEDRLTFSAVFVFDKSGKITSRWFGKTVIHSAKRFSYEEAQTVLENLAGENLRGLEIFPKLQHALLSLDRMAKKMRAEREKNGAIGFDTEEVRFRLAPDGTPIEAYVKDRKEAHLLIEDFMLLANKEVAVFMDAKGEAAKEVPFVYRIHDLPDMEKVAEFARFAAEMGQKLLVDTPKQIAQSYNTLMRAAQKDERLKLLEPLAIRTMAKAVYSTNNIGHFGLGFTHYAHFTSPIRRYSDVLAHRILYQNLHGQTVRQDKTKLEEQCKHVSAQEKKAAEAERESIKYKQAELTQRQIGQVMTGIISGMVERGFFVELPGSKAEGMVAFRDLEDVYLLAEGNLSARGRHSRRVFKMGDRVKVRVAAVDLQRRQIELELAED